MIGSDGEHGEATVQAKEVAKPEKKNLKGLWESLGSNLIVSEVLVDIDFWHGFNYQELRTLWQHGKSKNPFNLVMLSKTEKKTLGP